MASGGRERAVRAGDGSLRPEDAGVEDGAFNPWRPGAATPPFAHSGPAVNRGIYPYCQLPLIHRISRSVVKRPVRAGN